MDRYFQTRFELVDEANRIVRQHDRDLGYIVYAPHTWPPGFMMRERYRLVLDDELPPGEYRVVMRVRWRAGGESGDATPDDPRRYDPEGGIELGRLRVVPR
jgi:hypothetical protein